MFCLSYVAFGLMLLFAAVAAQRPATQTPAAPARERFRQATLIRRVRSFIFPNKAFLLLTPVLNKAILGGRPRGLAFSLEFDMYSPLPDTIEGWQPTILLKHHKNTKPHAETAVVNATVQRSRIAVDYLNAFEPIYIPHSYHTAPLRKHDYQPQLYPDMARLSNYMTKQRKHFVEPVPSAKLRQWATNRNAAPKWKFQQNYRERRELYDQLEAVGHIFNIDMRACIQRAMCEMSARLKPYGESLIEDLVRIILNIPTEHDFLDDYSQAMLGKQCTQRLLRACPHSFIDILTSTTRTK